MSWARCFLERQQLGGLDAMVMIRFLDVGLKFCLVGTLLSIVPCQKNDGEILEKERSAAA